MCSNTWRTCLHSDTLTRYVPHSQVQRYSLCGGEHQAATQCLIIALMIGHVQRERGENNISSCCLILSPHIHTHESMCRDRCNPVIYTAYTTTHECTCALTNNTAIQPLTHTCVNGICKSISTFSCQTHTEWIRSWLSLAPVGKKKTNLVAVIVRQVVVMETSGGRPWKL
jgi:hypothetical protein